MLDAVVSSGSCSTAARHAARIVARSCDRNAASASKGRPCWFPAFTYRLSVKLSRGTATLTAARQCTVGQREARVVSAPLLEREHCSQHGWQALCQPCPHAAFVNE